MAPMKISAQRVGTIALLAVLGPVGIMLNMIVMIAIVRKKRLHTCTYMLYFHLAVCDILTALFGSTMGISIYTTGDFIFCQCVAVMIVFFYVISIGTVALIAYDRFVYLSSPLLYFVKVTKTRVLGLLVCIWSVSICNLVPVLWIKKMFVFNETVELKLSQRNCIISRVITREFLLWTVVVLTILPTLVAAILNIKIYHLASLHHKKIQKTTISWQRTQNVVKKNAQGDVTSPSSTINKRQINKKAVRTTMSIVVTHLICTMPYLTVIIIEASCDHCIPYKQIKYAYSLFLLNYLTAVLNPLIYTLTNAELRREIKIMLRLCRHKSKVVLSET